MKKIILFLTVAFSFMYNYNAYSYEIPILSESEFAGIVSLQSDDLFHDINIAIDQKIKITDLDEDIKPFLKLKLLLDSIKHSHIILLRIDGCVGKKGPRCIKPETSMFLYSSETTQEDIAQKTKESEALGRQHAFNNNLAIATNKYLLLANDGVSRYITTNYSIQDIDNLIVPWLKCYYKDFSQTLLNKLIDHRNAL